MARCFFLACFILCGCRVSGQTYGLQGMTINLNPGYAAEPDNILWKHNGNKVVEFNGNEQHVYGQFLNRVTLDWISAELQISDLRYEDSGIYEVEIDKNNKLDRYRYKLEVIGKVNKPTISCDMNDGSSDGTRATLMCSAEPTHPQSLVKFEWVSPGTVQPGSNLPISLGGELDDKTYTCRVRNPLTNGTDTFTAKDCYPEEGAFVALAVILPIIIIILVLLLVLGLVFCKLKNKACFAERNRDVEKQWQPDATEAMRLYTSHESDEDEVHSVLLDRAPTLPSQQRLGHLPQSHRSVSHKVDKGEGHDMEGQDERPQKGNVQNMKRHFEDLFSPPLKESETEADENEEEKSPPANVISPPTAKPRSQVPSKFADKAEDTAGEQEEDANSDQVHGETDLPGSEKRNGSDDSSEKKESPTVPEQNSSEIALHEQGSSVSQEETHATKDEQPEKDETASEDKSKPEGIKIADSETEEPQPQSPTQTKPDDTKTNISQEPLNTPCADSKQKPENKTRHDAHESEGQSESSTAEADQGESESKTDEKNEDEGDSQEEN